ncbi:hypothetical protein [Nesterenkonia alkaliphila]|nr:hypothetical protein [Nesterenkonia alkaliphila]
MSSSVDLRLARHDEGWALAGADASRFGLVNDYRLFVFEGVVPGCVAVRG